MASVVSLWARLGLDASGVQKGAKKARAGFAGISLDLKKLAGLVGAGTLLKLGLDAAKTNDEIAKLARATGASTEALSAYRYGAEDAGIATSDLAVMMRALAKRTGEFAATGGGPAAKAIEAMGSGFADMVRNGAPLEQIMEKIADRVRETSDAGQRLFIVDAFFSETGRKAISFFTDGAAGLRRMREEAEELGIVLAQKDADAAEEFQKALLQLQKALDGVVQTFVRDLTPALTDLAGVLQEFGIPLLRNFARELREIVDTAKSAYQEIQTFITWAEAAAKFAGRQLFGGPQQSLMPAEARALVGPSIGPSGATGGTHGAALPPGYMLDTLGEQAREGIAAARALGTEAITSISDVLAASVESAGKMVGIGVENSKKRLSELSRFTVATVADIAGGIGTAFAAVIQGQATAAEALHSVMSSVFSSMMGQLFAMTAEAIGLHIARMVAGVTATEGARGGIWGVIGALAAMTAIVGGVTAAISRGQSTGRSSVDRPVGLATGGDVLATGAAVLHRGERVLSERDVRRTPAGGFAGGIGQVIEVRIGERVIGRVATEQLHSYLRVEGVLP